MSTKPRVLVTASTFPRSAADPEPRFVLDLAQALTKYFRVTVLVPADPTAALSESMGDVAVVRYRYAPLRSLETLAYPGAIMPRLRQTPWKWLLVPGLLVGLYWALNRELRRQRYAAVHAHWLLPQGIVQAVLSYRRHAPPFLLTSHGGDIHTFARWPFLALLRWVVNRAAGITVVSAAIRDEMEASLGVPGQNITVIPMGADLNRFSPHNRDPAWVSAQGLCHPVFLFVGRLAEKKGLRYLLDAFALDRIRATNATLAIVGDGPQARDLHKQAQTLRLHDRVKFLGPATHADLPTIYASSDALCVPSIVATDGDTEGLPTVLIEAAASGLPAIGTRTGGIPDFIVDGKTGQLVDPRSPPALADACLTYITGSAMRCAHGSAARQRAADYSWPNIAEGFRRQLTAAAATQPS